LWIKQENVRMMKGYLDTSKQFGYDGYGVRIE